MSFLNLCSILSPFCCVLRGSFPGWAISRNLCVKALRKGRESSLSCISSSLSMSSGEAVRIRDAAIIESPLSFSVRWLKPSFSHPRLPHLGEMFADFMDVWKKNQAEMLTNAFVMLLFGFHFQTLAELSKVTLGVKRMLRRFVVLQQIISTKQVKGALWREQAPCIYGVSVV